MFRLSGSYRRFLVIFRVWGALEVGEYRVQGSGLRV